MGIIVAWYDEQKTIIHQVYGASWEWEEYLASFQKISELAGEVDYRVGIIAEVADVKQIPPHAIMYGLRVISNLPANVDLAVIITPSQLMMSILKVIQTMTRFTKLTTASSVEKARILIELRRNASSLKPQ